MSSKVLHVSIPAAWQQVRHVRSIVEEALASYPDEIRHAAVMTASELVENALKHGDKLEGSDEASFTLTIRDNEIRIEVANGAGDPASIEELKRRIDQLTAVPSKEDLYIGRLHELLNDSTDNGKLGLYRIGFEGQFELSLDHNETTVTVTATRRCNHAK